ncbi:hypothetical protein ADUPG1_003712, partial [Aduncisulcus paluster]
MIEIAEKPDWPWMVPVVQNILNHHKNATTGTKPQELMFGKFTHRSVVKDWSSSRKVSEEEMPKGRKAEIEFVKTLTDNIETIRRYAETKQRESEMKKIGKEEEKGIERFEIGESVFVRNHTDGTKLKPGFFGPFEISGKPGAKTYIVKNDLEP